MLTASGWVVSAGLRRAVSPFREPREVVRGFQDNSPDYGSNRQDQDRVPAPADRPVSVGKLCGQQDKSMVRTIASFAGLLKKEV